MLNQLINFTLRTSHSLTTSRTNALIGIQIDDLIGYGEVGLPPKKPLCYLADYSDVENYFSEFNKTFSTLSVSKTQYDPFSNLEPKFFSQFRQNSSESNTLLLIVRTLFKALDECPMNSDPSSRAAHSGIEAALFDLWGQIVKQPIYSLIGFDNPTGKPSFYTAALNPEIDQIVDTAKWGFQYTPYLKIKLDSDVEKGFQILNKLKKQFEGNNNKNKWSIDANSAWTPEISMKFLDFLNQEPFKSWVYMVEQPFPVELTKSQVINEEEMEQWRKVKLSYEEKGFLIYADESVATSEDIEKLGKITHGVNIKLEKTGGIREALRVVTEANKYSMKIWVGIMVSSRLNCNTAVHLLSVSDNGGDLDGPLLVDEPSQLFEGGFEWISYQSNSSNENHGLIKFDEKERGVGVHLKNK